MSFSPWTGTWLLRAPSSLALDVSRERYGISGRQPLVEGEALAPAEAGSVRGGKLPGSGVAERCQAEGCWAA